MDNLLNTKNIDDLQELGKLTGSEMTLVSYENDTRKVAIDTIIGYAASILANTNPKMMSLNRPSSNSPCIVFVPSGEQISVNERTPGCFYLEESNQTSIRTQINIPTSVKVSASLGLRRL